MIHEVQRWLSFYPGADVADRNRPTPANYRDSLKVVEGRAKTLRESLLGLHPWIAQFIDGSGLDSADMADALDWLVHVAQEARAAGAKGESRGAPPRMALRHLIGKLRRIFRRYWRAVEGLDCSDAPPHSRRRKGAVEALSEVEASEKEFVEAALLAAKIGHPKQLRKLFSQLGAAVPDERQQVIEMAAHRIRAKRTEAAQRIGAETTEQRQSREIGEAAAFISECSSKLDGDALNGLHASVTALYAMLNDSATGV